MTITASDLHPLSEARTSAIHALGDLLAPGMTVALSTHPTVCEGRLAPRHVDLRPFAYSTPAGVRVLAGGLTRVALREGSLIVNSSRDGGAKDTWVLDE